MRGIPPSQVADFAEAHDEATWQCFMRLLSLPLDTAGRDLASLPFQLGGCGLLSATRSRVPARWASLADSLRTIHGRHPALADMMVRSLSEPTGFRHFDAAASCREELPRLNPKHWQLVSLGCCWPFLKKVGSGMHHRSWSSSSWTLVSQDERALLRSQGGPLLSPQCRSVLFSGSIPTSFVCSFCGALSLPSCWCGRPLDWLGHHRASCALTGVLGRRGFALESAAARVCREAGARVSTNVFLRDLDLLASAPRINDALRLLPRDFPFFTVRNLPSTPLSSLLSAQTENLTDGVQMLMAQLWWPLDAARPRTYPELVGDSGRAKLVVLAGEIGGRFSEETHTFVRLLARAKTRSIPEPLRTRARQSWVFRWGGLFWLVPQPRRLRLRCWIIGATREPTAPHRRAPPVEG